MAHDFRTWPVHAPDTTRALLRRHPDGHVWAKSARTQSDVADLADERDRLVWLAAQGLPVPHVLDWFEGSILDEMDGTLPTLVMTGLPGVSADRVGTAALFAAPDSVREAFSALSDLDVDTCAFEAGLATLLPRLPSAEESPDAAALLDPAVLEPVAAAEADDMVVCHGRARPEHVVLDERTGHLVGIVGVRRLGVADRHLDIATATRPARGSVPLGQDPWTLSADPARISFYRALDSLLG